MSYRPSWSDVGILVLFFIVLASVIINIQSDRECRVALEKLQAIEATP